MNIRQITPNYFVSPQIDPADLPAIKEAGFSTVICNRPDAEIPASHHAETMAAAATEAGLDFKILPLTRDTLMQPDNIAQQGAYVTGADDKVLAYCASGTRSTMIWAMGQAGTMPTEAILDAAAQGGYDLSMLEPVLDAMSQG